MEHLDSPDAARWRAQNGLPTLYADLMRAALIDDIDRRSRGPLGDPNPVAVIACPHCGGTMAAIDAKAHVRTVYP